MDIFDFLKMLGGLCLFLFGMNIMGQALERRAGNSLKLLIGKMTSSRFAGFLTGCGVTAVIQSSSATTVMVVGFVNSELMSLRQAINVIMGANVGTTITSWVLSLSGIESENFFIRLLKPSSFTPVLALLGVILYIFMKGSKRKDSGMILLGFATLMFGMETMSSAVAGLSEIPAFKELFIMFTNPFLGLLAGALLTAVIQSSSASVGILQALAATGQVTVGAAVPIIMGQNIGTCITALLSSVGAGKNAKRAAFVHLSFNVIGSVVLLGVFSMVKAIFNPLILADSADAFSIAVIHTIFNLLCVAVLMPAAGLLEKLSMKLIKDKDGEGRTMPQLDERLLATPPLALDQCRAFAVDMARCSVSALKKGFSSLSSYTPQLATEIRDDEEMSDHYEDIIGTYLIKLSSVKQSEADSEKSTMLLKTIGDFERISDHGVNILESAEEMRSKKLDFSDNAKAELEVLSSAVVEILDISFEAFKNNDIDLAIKVEPLEQVVDDLKEKIRTRHIRRMQQGECSVNAGFVLSDLLTDMERVSDHCSNIAGCIIDSQRHNLNLHETLRATKAESAEYVSLYKAFAEKYTVN